MDINKLRALAGLPPVITEKKWSGDVETHKHPPEGLFATGSKAKIVAWLKESHPEFKSAMSALNFYINRSGKGLSADRLGVLNSAKDALRAAYGVKEALEPFDVAQVRHMAGLQTAPELTLEVAKDVEVEADAEAEKPADQEETPELPEIVTKIAAKAEGKTGDDLVDLINKVYDAGVKDGKAQAEEDEKGESKKDETEKPVEEAAPIAEASGPLVPHLAVTNDADAGRFAVALAKSGTAVDMEEFDGVFYFNFKSAAIGEKAEALANKLKIKLQGDSA